LFFNNFVEGTVPDNITVASVVEYKTNVELLMQQEGSRLRGMVTTDNYVGKSASVVEQFGSATAVERTSRHADTPLLDLSQDKRWVQPKDIEWGSLIDQVDKLRMRIAPEGMYTRAASAGMNRKLDDIIIAAFFATAYIGENGTSTETMGTVGSGTYDVGVNVGGTASGLNVAKLQNGLRLLMTANAGDIMEPVYSAISSYEHDLLLKEIQIANKDYNGGAAVLESGRIRRFMGFDFALTERLTITAGNRLLPAWVKSGMHLAVWQDLQASIDKRPDKGNAWQVYTNMTVGSTRLQAGKVIRINCDDQI
jgi:Phage capsid protein